MSLLSHWETAREDDWGIVTVELAWLVEQSQKLGMSCQDTDMKLFLLEMHMLDYIDTGREIGEKQKLS